MLIKVKTLDNEAAILQRLQAGDENAFGEVYHHYSASVKAQVEYLLHSPNLSDDVSQEIFLKIWEGREKLSEVRSFKAYLFITVRNHTLNALKKAANTHAGMSEIIRHFARNGNTTEDDVQSREYLQFIQRELEALPPRSREIFRMCREQSKSYDEVAAALGITRDAVKSRMVHAMKTLRNSAKKEMGLPLTVILILINWR